MATRPYIFWHENYSDGNLKPSFGWVLLMVVTDDSYERACHAINEGGHRSL